MLYLVQLTCGHCVMFACYDDMCMYKYMFDIFCLIPMRSSLPFLYSLEEKKNVCGSKLEKLILDLLCKRGIEQKRKLHPGYESMGLKFLSRSDTTTVHQLSAYLSFITILYHWTEKKIYKNKYINKDFMKGHLLVYSIDLRQNTIISECWMNCPHNMFSFKLWK